MCTVLRKSNSVIDWINMVFEHKMRVELFRETGIIKQRRTQNRKILPIEI